MTKKGKGMLVVGSVVWRIIESKNRLAISSITTEPKITEPKFVLSNPFSCNEGIITAIDDDTKIVPIKTQLVIS